MLLLIVPLLLLASCGTHEDTRDYYAISLHGHTLGWIAVEWDEPAPGASGPLAGRAESRARVSILNQIVDIQNWETYELDPVSGETNRFERRTVTGQMEFKTEYVVEGDTVRITLPQGGGQVELPLGPDLRRESGMSYTSVLAALRQVDPPRLHDTILDTMQGKLLERDAK